MNYLELINSYWQLARGREPKITVSAALLYFALLAESNSRGWQNPLFVGSATITALTGIAGHTLIRARRELAAAGLIEYTPGDGRGNATAYKIKVAEIAPFAGKAAKIAPFEPEKGAEKGAKNAHHTKQKQDYKDSQSGRQENPANFAPFGSPQPERENPGKEKETAPEGAAPESARNRAILDDNAQGGGIPQPNPQTPLSANSRENNYQGAGPTLAQVEAEQRAKGYQLEAARFYSHFAPDWKTANGEPIRSWRKLYAWCEKNGLFDTATPPAQGQQLPAGTTYTSRMPGDPPQKEFTPKRWDPGEPQSNWL